MSTTGLLNGQCCGLYSKAVGPEDPSQVAATDLKTAQLAICKLPAGFILYAGPDRNHLIAWSQSPMNNDQIFRQQQMSLAF